jgi:hypothetical protein
MGFQASSRLVLLFSFLVYVIPIFGGWRADVYVGQYKAIIVEVLTCGLAHIIQVIGAIPPLFRKGQQMPRLHLPSVLSSLRLALEFSSPTSRLRSLINSVRKQPIPKSSSLKKLLSLTQKPQPHVPCLYAGYHLRRNIGCHFCSHESSICCSQFFWQLFTRKCTGSRLVEDLN